jgi:hypothetical protein
MSTSMGEQMGTALLGHRWDGRPFYLIHGGADDAPEVEPEAQPPAPAPAPPVPAPPADDAAALRAELAAMRAENEATKAAAARSEERLRALMAGGPETPPPPAEEDEEEAPEPKGPDDKPVDPEMAKMRRLLREANRESKSRREAADKLRADWEAQDKQRQAEVADAQRLSEAAEKARQEAEARYRPATIKLAALPAFLAAGANPERAEKLIRLLDMSGLDVDEQGGVTGLADQVAAVKADYPELFARPVVEPPEKKAPRMAGGDRPPVEQQPSRTADRLAAQAMGAA